MKPGGLGRGLSALIPSRREEGVTQTQTAYMPFTKTEEATGNRVMMVGVEKIDRNPEQPRQDFAEADLQDLAQSIREHGILQPLLVTKTGDRFTLIAGERRLRAAKRADLKEVPCLVHVPVTDREQLELAIIENVQREDLSVLEQAIAYKKLHEEFNMTHGEIAQAVGKERPSITNIIRILDLPDEMQKALKEGKMNFGQARTLLAVTEPEKQKEAFQKILEGKLSTKAFERFQQKTNVQSHQRVTQKDPQLAVHEEEMGRVLGTRVRIKKIGESGGNVIIEFYSDEELSGIIEKINREG
ncbi:MAG: ParB/RepB/Spo0J family partition protein [bacterium]|nr:ParB/RepB/Spo0J family partition protein [bacterium]